VFGLVMSWHWCHVAVVDRHLELSLPAGAAGAGGGVVGPSRRDVAHTALLNLLQSNVEELFDVCLDKCYDTDRDVANTYFQASAPIQGGSARKSVSCPP
jgi:hypothetical protein